jgi:hypothetical protein
MRQECAAHLSARSDSRGISVNNETGECFAGGNLGVRVGAGKNEVPKELLLSSGPHYCAAT